MSCCHLLDLIVDTYEENTDLVTVEHNPMSPRYYRAEDYLEDIILKARCLGFCETRIDKTTGGHLVVVIGWIGPTDNPVSSKYGQYIGFRCFYESKDDVDNSIAPKRVIIFAYYDNAPSGEDKENLAFETDQEAAKFMVDHNSKKDGHRFERHV